MAAPATDRSRRSNNPKGEVDDRLGGLDGAGAQLERCGRWAGGAECR
jgi:hypothetical protein